MMTQEQMEVEIMKLETENDEIKRTISEMQQEIKMANNEINEIILEMQQEIKVTVSLLKQVAVLMTSRK